MLLIISIAGYILFGLVAGYITSMYMVNNSEMDTMDMIDTAGATILSIIFGYISFFVVVFIALAKQKTEK